MPQDSPLEDSATADTLDAPYWISAVMSKRLQAVELPKGLRTGLD
jgi:hypothetical protein